MTGRLRTREPFAIGKCGVPVVTLVNPPYLRRSCERQTLWRRNAMSSLRPSLSLEGRRPSHLTAAARGNSCDPATWCVLPLAPRRCGRSPRPCGRSTSPPEPRGPPSRLAAAWRHHQDHAAANPAAAPTSQLPQVSQWIRQFHPLCAHDLRGKQDQSRTATVLAVSLAASSAL